MRQTIPILGLSLLALAVTPAVRGEGGSSAPSVPSTRPQTPQEMAAEVYNQGLRHRDKAWKLEEKAQAASAAERAKLEEKIRKQYENAAEEFEKATRFNPRMYQAYSDLGYVLRKLGSYQDSLAAYDRALALEPGYPQAIEYRAEAYLGLNRLEDAKQSYMQLFRGAREQADLLMAAMKRWVEERRSEPAGVDAQTLEAFAGWVAEREQMAAQTAKGSKSSW